MTYRSDRQRAELMLLPMIAQSVIKCGAAEPDAPDAIEAINHFAAAMQEALVGADEKKRYQLIRRTMRLHHTVTKPYSGEGSRVDKVGLMLYYLTNWAIGCGYLVIGDDTPMAKGMDLLLPGLEHAANIAKLDASAQKAAGKLLASLQAEGYFIGVEIAKEAA